MNGKKLQRQHKDWLSDFRNWDQLVHAKEYLLFADNVGTHLSLDETAFSQGELYTIITNKAAKGKQGAIVATIVAGTAYAALQPPQSFALCFIIGFIALH